MNNVLLWIGGLLVAVLAALFTVPHFVDWTSYRGAFEEEASRVLGREVRVAGAVNLRLLPTPYVRFEKVRFADAAGQTGEPFFRADDFTLWLAPAPLLRGAIEAREVELRRPTLKLRLNAQGGGNWQTLSITRAGLPFVPSDVTLQSVQITEGTISIDDPSGRELVRVGGITGDLSVAALEGPFKFKGVYIWNGERHELKVATAPFDADGGLRANAQVTANATANSYTLDGKLADLGGKARFDGSLNGNLGLQRLGGGSTSAKPQRVPVELRAAVSGDAKGAKLTDLNLSFEQDGKPQLVSGGSEIAWWGGLDVGTELSTRWIDLDHLLGGTTAARPFEAAQTLAPALGLLIPGSGRGRTSFKAEQITLGGESISGLDMLVESENGALRLTHLHAGLPGGTRLRLAGKLPAPDTFDGEVNLRGANLSRMLTWLGHGAVLAEARTEGSFSLKSRLVLGPKSVAVRDAFASMGQAVLTGGVSYAWADRPRVDIVLEGDQIDLGLAFPRALDLHALINELGAPRSAATAAKPQTARYAIDPSKQDASLRIRAARLLDAERDLRDVDVDATLINGRLDLQRMRFVSAAGLEIEAEGEVGGSSAGNRTSLRGTAAATDKVAITELVELLDQSGTDRATLLPRVASLVPARVAWTFAAGDGTDESRPAASIWIDGAVLGRRLTLSMRLAAGLKDWRRGDVGVHLAIERPDWQRLRSVLALDTGTARGKPAAVLPSSTRSRLTMKLSGRPDESLGSYLKLEDDSFEAGLSGHVVLGKDAIASAGGELQLRAPDLAQALAALGIAAGNLPAFAVDGAADLTLKDRVLRITPAQLEVAGAIVGGELQVTRVDNKDRHRIEGRLTTTQAAIPRLLDLVVDGQAKTADQRLWSPAAFDFSLLEKAEGRVRLEAAELSLAPEVSLGRAIAVAEFAPGKLDILSLDGDLLGTRLTSRWLLEKAAAGASLSGNVKAEGMALDKLGTTAAGQAPRLGGKASIAAAVSGRGLSPQGLLSALTGKGEIAILNGRTSSVSPLMARRIAEDVVTGQKPATIESVEQAVTAMMADPAPELQLALGNRKLAIDIGDGAVKITPFTVDHADGRSSNRTTLELATLKLDSEWKIEEGAVMQATAASGTARQAGPLPPITVVFLGPAARLGRLEQVISVDALVRELGVRRMERDVEELERLRRLDEERAKADAERRRAEEAARTAAATAGAAAMPAPPGPWMPVIVPAAPPPPQTQQAGGTPGQDGNTPAAEPTKAPDRRRTTTTGSTQPSSQQLKSRIQDVFKNQNGR